MQFEAYYSSRYTTLDSLFAAPCCPLHSEMVWFVCLAVFYPCHAKLSSVENTRHTCLGNSAMLLCSFHPQHACLQVGAGNSRPCSSPICMLGMCDAPSAPRRMFIMFWCCANATASQQWVAPITESLFPTVSFINTTTSGCGNGECVVPLSALLLHLHNLV